MHMHTCTRIKHVYGSEEMARAKEDPVGFAWERDMGQDAVHQVSTQLWQGELAGKKACEAGDMYDVTCYAGISPHLECTKNSCNNHNLYLIAGARAGPIALGYVLDRLYPPSAPCAPFCPCCRDSVQDTLGHQLSGECKGTRVAVRKTVSEAREANEGVGTRMVGQVLGCILELPVGSADLGSAR